ncbi:type II secretion system minor pseudopilin GspK [Hyphococcus sp.]|uniref:type II secretion system minor pseudopilin GspK n=1 Tax=Hyphococcus sp. TaxID=2038636 RepID=UPI003CCBC3AF
MNPLINPGRSQRGAALLIVLLLAATLSFVALASMEKTTLAAARTMNVQSRGEAIWRGFATEALAVAAIERAYSENNGQISLDDPWASEPLVVPFEEGAARIAFVDASLCFNINSLRQVTDNPLEAPAIQEFIRLAGHLEFSEFEAAALAETIADWVDDDASRRPQGAEDEYYTVLPSPYRTANQPAASVSEIRAVKGVTRFAYHTLKPYLCASPDDEPNELNVNMLSERHAPVLAAALGPEATLQSAIDIIAARPVGGYENTAAFLANPLIEALGPPADAGERFTLVSKRLKARAEIIYDTAVVEVTTDLAVDDTGAARVLSRRIGAEE